MADVHDRQHTDRERVAAGQADRIAACRRLVGRVGFYDRSRAVSGAVLIEPDKTARRSERHVRVVDMTVCWVGSGECFESVEEGVPAVVSY